MNLRGTVVETSAVRSVDTRYGERDLAEIVIRTLPDGSEPDSGLPIGGDDSATDGGVESTDPGAWTDDSVTRTVTLWGNWAETTAHLEPGMTLAVTEVSADEWNGEQTYATTGDSFVVVEPERLVNVTDIRAWVQCPRIDYLNSLSGVPLAYPVVKGTIVHEVFGDLLRGRDREAAVEDAVADAGLELGLLDREADSVSREVDAHARALEGWLAQGTLSGEDEWRSELTLFSETFGIKGRCDAVRRGTPVELKTGKNTSREPRFPDKIQAAAYALLLRERGESDGDTGTLLYTKNAALDRGEASGDLSPAKEFSIGRGLLEFVVRSRNEIAAAAFDRTVPTGEEADAKCEYCFERDTCMVVAGRLDQRSKAGAIGSPIPEEERAYFERFAGYIEAERDAIHRSFADLWQQRPDERAAADRALIDLEPVSRHQLDDGRWELQAKGTGAVSKIREGDVALASEGDPVGGRAEVARVEAVGEDVIVTTDEPLDLRRLDVYPSEFGTDRMLGALHDFVLKGDERRKDVLFGRRDPSFRDDHATYVASNPAQNRAVNRAVNAEDFALIHGPPGTGKTHTIARLIRALVADGQRVLLSAFTNRAVDNALGTLREQGHEDAVRVGTESGIRPDMLDLRLDPRGDPHERAATLNEAPVVAATASSAGSRMLETQSFDVVVVDEAAQLTEPATLAAINRGDRFVLVGDHHQLPPVVRSGDDLSRSLFERLAEEHPDAAAMLDRQYRMAQQIQAFSSREFYDGALRPADETTAAQLPADIADVTVLPGELQRPVAFVDVPEEGAGSADETSAHANAAEAEHIGEIVSAYEAAGVPLSSIGVITPFRAQVARIDALVPEDVMVDTVDRFQGSSADVIVISFVATGELSGPIFEDHRRLNVALTRARNALVLVGNEQALRTVPLYARMVDWASA